jgi:hypothetical protein
MKIVILRTIWKSFNFGEHFFKYLLDAFFSCQSRRKSYCPWSRFSFFANKSLILDFPIKIEEWRWKIDKEATTSDLSDTISNFRWGDKKCLNLTMTDLRKRTNYGSVTMKRHWEKYEFNFDKNNSVDIT